jgi:hypothetical protein
VIVPKAKIVKAHHVAKGFYAITEHACAVAYAACEFLNAHTLIVGCAIALLGAAVLILGLKIAEVL